MARKIRNLLQRAAEVARVRRCARTFIFGVVAVRQDGTLVESRNVATDTACHARNHAESRISRKIGPGSVLYLVRLDRNFYEWTLAEPCESCRNILRARHVSRVYYTTGPGTFSHIVP